MQSIILDDVAVKSLATSVLDVFLKPLMALQHNMIERRLLVILFYFLYSFLHYCHRKIWQLCQCDFFNGHCDSMGMLRYRNLDMFQMRLGLKHHHGSANKVFLKLFFYNTP